MTTLAGVNFPNRQPAGETNGTKNLGARRLSEQKDAALETLGKLRSLLASIENALSNDHAHQPRLREQIRDWEHLHQVAVEAVDASIPSESKTFMRRISAEAALSGLRFT